MTFNGPNGNRITVPCYANHCDGHFVERKNKRDGSIFYGCSNFPECYATMSNDRMNDIKTLAYGEEPFDALEYVRWDR